MTPPGRRDIPVFVSDHARERMRVRFPDVKPARIVDEVRDAMAAGRFSADKPDWVTNRYEGALYVWTPDGARAYTLVVDRFTEGSCFAVTTVLRRPA